MKLYSHPASPFARKVRVVAHELDAKLEVINVNPAGNAELRRVNPLGKIPALVLDDGSALFDSPVICEYLNERHGGKFFPGMSIWRSSTGRWRALGLQALGDGIADAAVARMAESRLPESQRNTAAMAKCLEAITVSLDTLERAAPKLAAQPTIGEIAVGCAIGYLDFRMPEFDWRTTRPNLRDWFEKFSQYGSMLATAPANLA
jgi:glutathione S-transferase